MDRRQVEPAEETRTQAGIAAAPAAAVGGSWQHPGRYRSGDNTRCWRLPCSFHRPCSSFSKEYTCDSGGDYEKRWIDEGPR